MRLEVYKLVKHLQDEKEYKPFKMEVDERLYVRYTYICGEEYGLV